MLKFMNPVASGTGFTLPFRPVDVSAQARLLKLEQRGREDGIRNQPDTHSGMTTVAEQEVLTAIHAERERCLGDLNAHLRADRDALAQLQTAMDIAGMRQAADEAATLLVAIETENDGSLARAREAAAATEAEFRQFRDTHRLTRTVRQPKDRSFTWVLMAFLVVVEGVVNAWFFASGSDQGLLGGAVLAATFSATNVLVGVINGWFPLRWAHHRNLAIKALGIVLFPALLIAGVALNAFIAHYRDVGANTPEGQVLGTAWSTLVRDPAGLSSIESWMLFALGIVFSGVAVAKGFSLDDPHPGYGAHDRRRAAAQSAYESERQEMAARADEVRDDFTGELREKIETLRGSSSQRQQLLAARARHLSDFGSHEAHLAEAARHLLATYRMANEATRSIPAPARFGSTFSFPDQALERPTVRALLEDQGLEVNAERLIQELDSLRKDVLNRYERLLVGSGGARA